MHNAESKHIVEQLDSTQRDVIITLLYFDIFNYPLLKEEIKQFLPSKFNGKFDMQFEELVENGYIRKVGDNFFGITEDQALASRRIKGNDLAIKKMKAAYRMSRIISYFPFVECIMLSGSISKGYMQDDSDVDFFIITSPKRLWIARTLLILFKRLFLFNSRKYFCVNYFIDSEHLEIEEKNHFTAVESATLIPTFGRHYYEKYWNSNDWVNEYLPNSEIRKTENVRVSNRNIFKWLIEKSLSNFIGNYFDKWFMRITLSHWKSAYSEDLDNKDFNVAFKTTRSVSKSHPQFFQKKVLSTLEEKIDNYEQNKSVKLKD